MITFLSKATSGADAYFVINKIIYSWLDFIVVQGITALSLGDHSTELVNLTTAQYHAPI